MKINETPITELKVIEPTVFGDHRGWFAETFNDQKLQDAGINLSFIQDNHSYSATQGTLRGLHYQMDPIAQTKLVRCTRGAIFDVAVDIRVGSPTYKKWYGLTLTSENKLQLLVPQGFAHGFLTLTADAEVQYKVDAYYSPQHDRSILWNDPEIGIEWPNLTAPVLSNKDQEAPLLRDADNNFKYRDSQ